LQTTLYPAQFSGTMKPNYYYYYPRWPNASQYLPEKNYGTSVDKDNPTLDEMILLSRKLSWSMLS